MGACTRNSSSPTGPAWNPPGSDTVYSPTRITIYARDRAPETVAFENDGRGNPLTEQSDGKYRIASTFDSSGRVLTQSTLGWRDGAWADSLHQTYVYDARGNLIHARHENFKAGLVSHTTVSYNASFLETDYLHQSFLHDSSFTSTRSTRHYSGDGRLTAYVSENLDYTKQTRRDSITFAYGSNGKRSEEIRYSLANDGWIAQSKTEYRYNDTGAVTRTRIYSWLQDAWVLKTDAETGYDARGNFATSSIVFSSTGALADSNHHEHLTDAAGNLIQILEEYFRQGQLSSRKKTVFAYDEFHNPVSTWGESYADGSWTQSDSFLSLRFNGRSFYRGSAYKMEAEYSRYPE
jgi:hypothetical protein